MSEGRPDRWFGGYVFDLDGTVYLGRGLLPGAGEALARIAERRLPIVYLSNNTLTSPRGYERKLRSLGLPLTPGCILTPAVLLGDCLRERGVRRLHVIAEAPLRRQLRNEGFELTEEVDAIECVVAGFDRHLTYRKLLVAHRALERGVAYVATNPDRACPMPDGPWPDTAAVMGALRATTGREVDEVVGKPSRRMIEAAVSRTGARAEDCLMSGDRLDTDIRMARRGGLHSALVVATGDRPRGDVEPEFVVLSILDLLPKS